MRVTLDPHAVLYMLRSRGKTYVTVQELARLLGISTQAAGKLLARLAREGLAVRWSRRTYKLGTGDATPAR